MTTTLSSQTWREHLAKTPTATLRRTVDVWLVQAEACARAGDQAGRREAMRCWHDTLDELDRREEGSET